MINLIKLDFENCFRSVKFRLCFLFLYCISIFSFLTVSIMTYKQSSLQLNFTYKMGIIQGVGQRSVFQLILLLLPLITCGIYSDSFIYERDKNIISHYLTRTCKLKYFISKIFSIFIIVFFSIFFVLSINELLIFLEIPNIGVNHGYGITVYQLKSDADSFFLSSIYTAHPYLYNYLLILITSLYAALVAVIGFNISLLFHMKKITLYIYMFLGVHLISFILPEQFQIYNYIQSIPGTFKNFVITLIGWIAIAFISGVIGIFKEINK
ncbi:hypothetical protein [Clostridium brassicae]|uniref:ABC transporter permease n=1 Tax=Clostridium brassicae TaxID=2999072 RepID=A0ABT4DBJ5_9CLOT|nr:hypothetical protein [Clostridium brassicae]MCY6959660.1 hypothetical protein [Clostridium brassicae]